MANYSMFQMARDYFSNPSGFINRHRDPVLVWRLGGPRDKPIVETTHTLGGTGGKMAPTAEDPLVLELIKGTQSAFVFGVTIGRTENNDVVLRHDEVSRFHAYIQKSGQGFALVDADSKNGTFLDGVRLHGTKPAPLPSHARIGFGGLELEFYDPAALCAYFEKAPGG